MPACLQQRFATIFYLLVFIGMAMPDSTHSQSLPAGFLYLDQVIPDIRTDLRYRSDDNFVGAIVEGYAGSRAMLSQPAAQALSKVQAELRGQGLG